ncbi:DUF6894 family protein [Microvirga calopogonii]|uniref:DUF6894 family protein n=1 Tax=Microvirga calopogonii TaxID=2078013 RepID=UPI000E0D8257|nr:hypothetical protein [Microvirga calopogonii]
MPRFFFHVRGHHQELSRDELGLDFPDVETAYCVTFCAAHDIRAAFATHGQHPGDYTIEVTNAAEELVFSLPFSAAFEGWVPQLPGRFCQ